MSSEYIKNLLDRKQQYYFEAKKIAKNFNIAE